MVNLSVLNGKRIAVELVSGGQVDVVCGIGQYEQEHRCGACLRILVDEQVRDGVLAFVLDESKWDGDVWRDVQHGCEYRVRLELHVYRADR